jgi:hypothetical protein
LPRFEANAFSEPPFTFSSFRGTPPRLGAILKRLTIFSRQLQADASLTRQVRSIDVGSVEQPYIRELQAVFEVLLKHTPNLRHLRVPAGQFIEFLNSLLKEQNYLSELRSLETSYRSPLIYSPLQLWGSIFKLRRLSSILIHNCAHWRSLSAVQYFVGFTLTPPELQVIPPELRGKGDLPLRCINIQNSNLGYTILACLIRSCKRLEDFSYCSPSGWDYEDSEPATLIQALLLHKDSLKALRFEFRPRCYDSDGEDENFDQVPKLESLEEFSCLEELYVPQDCLPWKPLLPPSLKVLSIASPDEPLEPGLFYNLGKASHSSLKMLSELHVFLPDHYGWSDEIFDGFNGRVDINVL